MPDRIGYKREQVTIQYGYESADSEGQAIVAWSTLATVWGRGEFLSGRELAAMQQIVSEVSVKLTMGKRRDVTTKMQISWRSPVVAVAELWNILAILPGEDRNDMQLLLSKVQ